MRRNIVSFQAWGGRGEVEKRIAEWLRQTEAEILEAWATEHRLFVEWAPGSSRKFWHIAVLSASPNGNKQEQFTQFYAEHPAVEFGPRVINQNFLFWFWTEDD